ncbi:MAG: NrtA/SsuA/CpmA family ABC transporter substrate-binding protein [Thermodesulfobacteriota bacterium]
MSGTGRYRTKPVIVSAVLLLAGLTLLIFLLFKGGNYNDGSPATSADNRTETLRFGLALQPQSGLMIIALHNNYFKDEGLLLELHEYPSGKRALQEGLLTNAVDVITVSDAPLAFAAFDGVDAKAIATIFNAVNVNRIVGRRSAGIKTPADLHGKRIATQRASAVHYFLHLFLLDNNMTEKDYTPVFMKAEELPDAISSGSIDAFSMREPFVSRAMTMLAEDGVMFQAPGLYRQADVVLAGSQLLEQRPHVAERLLRALLRAETFVRQYPDKSIEITARRLGVDPQRLREIWPQVSLNVTLEQGFLRLLENQANWILRSGLRSTKELPNYLDSLHLQALEQVAPERVTVIH